MGLKLQPLMGRLSLLIRVEDYGAKVIFFIALGGKEKSVNNLQWICGQECPAGGTDRPEGVCSQRQREYNHSGNKLGTK